MEIKIVISIIAAALVAALTLALVTNERRSVACTSIGAEVIWGRDFSICAKPDGSLWRVP